MRHIAALLATLLLVACDALSPGNQSLRLPIPITNNAVALVGDTAYSFAGLGAGKTWKDVTSRAFACDLPVASCREIPGLPDGVGRLASAAVVVHGKIFLFGGYTVAMDATEVSTPDVWAFDPATETYALMTEMPVPVDDAVAVTYQDRYVYLISGWHDGDDNNVDLVQVLDTQQNRWFTATRFPGAPVFGHAGGIIGNIILICDGVKVVPPVTIAKRRTFAPSPACWRGEIALDDPAKISWSLAGVMPPAHYRMAATGFAGGIWFAGGSDNPYNYNGIGYDGNASTASKRLWRYDIKTNKFSNQPDKPLASMDHRAMLVWQDKFVIVGGMGTQQEVLDVVQIF
ncbi:Kelch motif domain protein [hydrothermal vent metagenome]|uniref:Kelch motif domain protein n=1 Tax=hydrothermal vent metagenome TaxID=652676 RepID=A0A3B0RTX6_9ZZZZ